MASSYTHKGVYMFPTPIPTSSPVRADDITSTVIDYDVSHGQIPVTDRYEIGRKDDETPPPVARNDEGRSPARVRVGPPHRATSTVMGRS
jgi:hypothetical protein